MDSELIAAPMPQVISLGIEPGGIVRWNGVQVNHATLAVLFRKASQQKPKPEIHIAADRLTRYDDVAKVLTIAQREGAPNFGFTGIDQGD